MSKPNRHPTHVLETKSKRFTESCFPSEWILNTPNSDYGIDYNVEIALNSQVTGLNFSVQLKGKETANSKDTVSVNLKSSTLSYYAVRLEPVMLIVYVDEEKEAYWIWLNDLNTHIKSGQKSYTIRFAKTNKLSNTNWEFISHHVHSVFNKRTFIGDFELLKLSDIEVVAWRAYYEEDYNQAIFLFRELLKENSNNVMTQALAWCLYMTHKYPEALATINQVLDEEDTSLAQLNKACILAEYGLSQHDKGKVILARDIFKKYIDEQSDGLIHYNYANTLAGLGAYDEAISHYRIALEKNPNNAECWKNLGSTYYYIHNHEEEMACYDKALAINPLLQQALFSKGITLAKVYGKYKEALTFLNRAMEGDSIVETFVHGFFWLAFVHENLGNIEEALKWINKGLEYSPSDISFLNFKSNLLASHWQSNAFLKQEAINFFGYRVELEHDPKSLYYLIVAEGLNRVEAFNKINQFTPLLRHISTEAIDNLSICWDDIVTILLYIEEYRDFRNKYELTRYTSNLLTRYFPIHRSFWELMNLCCAISYSKARSSYRSTTDEAAIPDAIASTMLKEVPKLISQIIPTGTYSQEIKVEVFPFLYLSYTEMIVRESAAQWGYIVGTFELNELDVDEYMTKEWQQEVAANVGLELNKKLKLFTE